MKLKDVALIFLGLCVAVLVFFLFRKRSNEDVVRAKDETIKAIQRERDAYKDMSDRERESIEQHRIKDSILNQIYLDNQKIHEEFEKELKDIPVNIRRIAGNDDSITARFKNFN